MSRTVATAALCAAFILPGAVAGAEGGDAVRRHLYAGTLAAGAAELAELGAAGDAEALFGAGLIGFVQAAEALAQGLYRHGLAAPAAGGMAPPLLMPVPTNPDPEPLDYDGARAMLAALVGDLDAARVQLEAAGAAGDWVVPVDVLQIRIDSNSDGTAEDSESIGAMLMGMLGPAPAALPQRPAEPPSRDGDKTGRGVSPASGPKAEPGLVVGFDRADALWLAGYSQIIAAQADFLLAHDFRATVDATFHRLFPRAGFPLEGHSGGAGMLMFDAESDTAIADAIAAIHSISWPVVERDRLAGVLGRLRAVTTLSRRNWEAILAETDDNAELVPNPRQGTVVPDGRVTEEVIAAWHETLDTVDRVLDGELLVPHWRFRLGFDLKAWFETAERTDLVMLAAGQDALPYLREGPVADAESFAAANRVFGGDFLGYAFWFN